MVGARTEAGPTAVAAVIRTGAVRMEAAGRGTRVAVGDISARAGQLGAAGISAAGGTVEDLEAGGRRDIRRRVGRLAGLTAAGRHGSLADIPRGHTAEGVTGPRAVAMADTT